MEAAAAFGLAANILQVVELAYKLLSTGHEIYQAGTTVQNSELEVLANDFTILRKRLTSCDHQSTSVLGPLTETDQVDVILYTTAILANRIDKELRSSRD
jgi:hypothetical protein